MKVLQAENSCLQAHDEGLVRRLRGGDKAAFVELYECHKRLVYVFCLKMLGESESASDVTHGVFLKVLQRHDQLTEPSKFRSWLMTIARNDCLTRLRESRMTVPVDECLAELESVPSGDVISLDIAQTEVKLIHQAIARLRPNYREVVVLREYQNLSYRQIAEVVGATESTVKFRLFAARRELCSYLRPLLARLRS